MLAGVERGPFLVAGEDGYREEDGETTSLKLVSRLFDALNTRAPTSREVSVQNSLRRVIEWIEGVVSSFQITTGKCIAKFEVLVGRSE